MHKPLPDAEIRSLFAELGCIAASASMLPVIRLAERASCVSDITVLIEGETGTGKQVLANAIHALDRKRCSFPFVTVHCGTITEALAESELFGHQRGAFSGATHDRKGLFQSADHGTLFLDDVNDLPMSLQAKLLDVLQRRIVRAVGSDQEVPVNARVIAASNQPLQSLVQQNRFRGDLFQRLNVVKLSIPPLRQRIEDLETLIIRFAAQNSDIYPHVVDVEAELLRFLATMTFPGNVRELEHSVKRMLFQKHEGTSLTLSDWMAQAPNGEQESNRDVFYEPARVLWNTIEQQGITFREAMHELEGRLLEAALQSGIYTRREIASRLQTSERTLYHRLRSHRLAARPALPIVAEPT